MGDERGLSSSVQVSLLLPLMLGVFLLGLQWAMVAWAQTTAHAAAQDAARATAALGQHASAGEAVGRDAANNGALEHIAATVVRGPVETTAVVTGRALAIVPWFPIDIRAEAAAATERLSRG